MCRDLFQVVSLRRVLDKHEGQQVPRYRVLYDGQLSVLHLVGPISEDEQVVWSSLVAQQIVVLSSLEQWKHLSVEELVHNNTQRPYVERNVGNISRNFFAIPRIAPQPAVPVNRADFFANVHEQRLRSSANANIVPSNSQRPPESYLQLQEYRQKQKVQHPPSHRGMMTLADLAHRDAPPASPGPQHHSVADFEDARNIALRAFHLTNEFRASQRLPPLTWNDGLGLIGKGHSEDMGSGKVPFGHQGFNNRFRSFPFPFTRGGAENVAMNAGLADVAKVAVDGWINSPGHRKNMLGNFNYSGIGVVRNTQGAWYLTQLFALAH